jgi:hypothetical protein
METAMEKIVLAVVMVALLFLCITGSWGQIGSNHRR